MKTVADTVTLILTSSVKGLHRIMKAQYRSVSVLARVSSSKQLYLHGLVKQTIRPT